MITKQRRKRLKRRSAANSTDVKPPSGITFYLDESIDMRALASGMRAAGALVVRPGEANLRGAADNEWARVIGQQGWFPLLRDQAVRRRPIERIAIAEYGVGAFICTAGEATQVEVTSAVLVALPKMTRICVSEPRPFTYLFGLSGALVRLPPRDVRLPGR